PSRWLPHFRPNARAAREEPPARAMTSVTWVSSGERPRRFQVPHREGSPPDQFDPERAESPMVAILDSIAAALAAPDSEAAGPSSIAELAAFSTRTLAQGLGGAAVLWLLDDSG